MPREIVGKIPEFSSEESAPTQTEEKGNEEVKKIASEEEAQLEKETPPEPPAEEKPAEAAEPPGGDTGELIKQVEGLSHEKERLLEEIKELRGQRREIKREEIEKVQEKIDELKDLNPQDIAVIERILQARGYVTREAASRMFYDSVKQKTLDQFLDKYPEYRPQNDPLDVHWNALQREMTLYRMPTNPYEIEKLLERAHLTIQKSPGDRGVAAKKAQLKIASMGAGGAQRSSSHKALPTHYREIYERGGWSEEEIRNIEQNLPE